MDRLAYVASSGARQIMLAQAVNANNLANASTTGFRADFDTTYSAFLNGAGLGSRVYAGEQKSEVDFREGSMQATGNPLDIAINGAGWFAVQALDGTEGLTRRGDLRVNELGQLTNGVGQPLMGQDGPIALPPFSDIQIGADGTISIVPLGESPNTVVAVDRIKLVNPENAALRKGEDGLLRLRNTEEETEADATVRVVSGTLEASNVNTIEAMVKMIELARQFETQMKMIKTAEDIDTSSMELMRVS